MIQTPSMPHFSHFHCFPPIPFTNNHRPLPFLTTNASSRTRTPKRRRFNLKKHTPPSSLPLHSKNPRSIYKDIQRLARQNKLKEALNIMDYLDQLGIPVNPTTFSALIASCIRSKSLPEAREIHVYMRVNGLDSNEFLLTKLVQLYLSCGSAEDAWKVFDEIPLRSVYPWNALIRGTVVKGGKGYREVVSVYGEMRSLGVDLNVYSFTNVIKSFAGASALKQGLKTHALLVKNGLLGSSVLMTSLIDMYCKCGKVRLAYNVFEEMPERDVVVWGAMISGFAHNRRHWEALEYVRWMVSEGVYPNLVILTAILPVIGEIWARKVGREVHGYVLKTMNYSRQLTIQSGLIDMYCKCGDMVSGRRVFYGCKERNTISWTALMSGYVSNGRPEQALRSVVWMQQEGFRPDVVSVATVIPVCTELKTLNQGKEVHAYAMKSLFFPNVSITTSLIKMYSECGVLDYSVKLFDGMENRNILSWTVMIDSYVKSGRVSEAFDMFRLLLLSNHRPDSVVVARMLNVCSQIKSLKLGKELHGHALKKQFDSVPSVSAAIVKLYGSCGLIDCAMSVFDMIPIKGSMTWTAIIEAHGLNSLWKDAIDLFNKMVTRGFTPTHFTFDVILTICDQGGFTNDAFRIFKLMSERYNLKVSEEQYSIISRLLTRSGRVLEARKLGQMSSSFC